MCLIVCAWQAHPRYRLIVAANRDEFHARPALGADWWTDQPTVLAGRDLQAGGSWLAVNRSGRFATVTNYREHPHTPGQLHSRGDLVTRFVTAGNTPLQFAGSLVGDQYAGFSLLASAGDSLVYASNRGDLPRALPAGVYGLSNATLDSPWPKLLRSRERLRRLLRNDKPNTTKLLSLLSDRTPADAGEAAADLRYSLPHFLSSPFVVSHDYGTRCSTAIMIGHDGSASFSECRFDRDGTFVGRSDFEFELEPR